MPKLKIVLCSDTLSHITGLGKTALRIAKGFYDSGDYDVSYFVLTGQDSDTSCRIMYDADFSDLFDHMNICNCQLQDPNKYKMYDDFISVEKPDIVLSLLDPWNIDQIEMSSYRNTYYWIAYCLFETPYYPEYAMTPSYVKPESPRKSIFQPLRNADLCIPVTKMGFNILKSKQINCTDNVYLGIDFDKRCTEELTKQKVFGSEVKDDDFVFMTVGRNSERKKLDKIIEAFALFLPTKKEEKIKYKLYIHTDFNEVVGGTDLIALSERLGVINNILFPLSFVKHEVMSDADLYKRYFVCDAYIELSAGEGFCYGILEGMLHNKPIIYLDYGGHVEYCKDFGYPVTVKNYYSARNIDMRWALADVDNAVDMMYNAKDLGRKKDSSAFVKNTFDWNSVIIPKLLKIVKEKCILKDKPKFNLRKII